MLARLIATVAALLLACASPQASAYVRAEGVSVSLADIANSAAPETALPAQIACKSKTAPPARASLEYPATGENAALTHWHTWGNPLSPEKSTSGNRDWLWDRAPFGDTAANEQPTGGLPNFTFNLRFPGQQYDRETGTHYNYFRDYEAGTGRYVQSDPIGMVGGLNTYLYAEADALGLEDALGLKTLFLRIPSKWSKEEKVYARAKARCLRDAARGGKLVTTTHPARPRTGRLRRLYTDSTGNTVPPGYHMDHVIDL